MPPDLPRIVWRLRHKKHRALAPLAQSPASISRFGNFKTSELCMITLDTFVVTAADPAS